MAGVEVPKWSTFQVSCPARNPSAQESSTGIPCTAADEKVLMIIQDALSKHADSAQEPPSSRCPRHGLVVPEIVYFGDRVFVGATMCAVADDCKLKGRAVS